MELTPFIDNLRREVALAAAAGGEDTQALAEWLLAPLESAIRLAMLEALSSAADEITRELAPGSVQVRLRGRDPEFVVLPANSDAESLPAPATAVSTSSAIALPEGDDGATSRINLRLPDQLKARIEGAASAERLSVNAWLVRAAAVALEPAPARPAPARRENSSAGQHFTGWVR
ncbi:hypothetical protein AB0N05_03710 [Nocardia sp. NPDC051030]|uniref:hypothetical protein n=1 Tax=Nocardia sp. NPDC051030 TaxID=3155162 RepID=UPI0034340EEB